ncbi:MAG: XdhC family protein [SAR324 cluster bacterium]|nr:XdhC family protein [SAR324 cluster bacterium]MCZ6646145.1 XdhC family protein [SAR324 cluster bacterium]MCZ6842975.1 XdhC family protein [SAR324 cluster bacterium]
MSNRKIYQEIEHQLREGNPVAEATVIQTKGSTPRGEGSRMLVRSDGSLSGTIGGGCGEAGVIQKARLSLHDGKIREDLADLTEDISTDSEAVCGGTLRVFIQPWQPTPERIALASMLKNLAGGDREVIVHQIVQDSTPEDAHIGQIVIQEPSGKLLTPGQEFDLKLPDLPETRHSQLKKIGEREIYTERWLPIPTLIVIGAGHIAEPLEQMARMCGFRTVVVDDRTLFANRQRFPDATQVVCGPILDVAREMELSAHSYLVLVTRGHTLDMDALRVVIDRGEPLAYLGMIGSTRRIRAVFQLLEEQGYSRDNFEHVHAPVGLDIGGETPAEIAVSIVAEMVSIMRKAGTDTRPLVSKHEIHPALRPLPGKARKAAGRD